MVDNVLIKSPQMDSYKKFSISSSPIPLLASLLRSCTPDLAFTGFLQGFLSEGMGAKSIVMQISIVMLVFLFFSDQMFWAKSLRGDYRY